MRTLAIAGVGLIGGSLGLALRKRGFPGTILGISSPKTIEAATARGAIDRGVSLEEAAAEADVILLAQPISVILKTIDDLTALARPDCLITDAGSTKRLICERAGALPCFVGGHPMAGKETAGIGAADADLFTGRPWIFCSDEVSLTLTPHAGDLLRWLTVCGAFPVYMDPGDHDQTVAWTSHLPQLLSTSLARSIGTQVSQRELVTVSGSGLRDMTRLAMSSWSVWRDILDTNADSIDHALQVYIDTLTKMRENLQTQRTGEDFSIAAEVAHRIRRGLQND